MDAHAPDPGTAVPARILVVGAGGIGGLLATKLAHDPRVEVSLAVRGAIPPLTLTTREGVERPPVRIVTLPEEVDPVDWVVVATKSYDVAGLAAWLRAPACAGARVVVAQNGVDHAERLAPHVPAERVVPMIVTYGAERRAPGEIVETLVGATRVPSNPAGRAFAEVAAGGPLTVEVVADFSVALWTKLVWNLVGNSLTAIADVPVRDVARRPELRDLGERLAAECCAVARARGVELGVSVTPDMLDMMSRYPATVRTSMWQDRQAGRPLEHQAISGAVVRAAEQLGLDAPYCRTVTGLLEAVSGRPVPPSLENIAT